MEEIIKNEFQELQAAAHVWNKEWLLETAVVWMFMSLQNVYVRKLMIDMMVLGDGACHKGRDLINEINILIEEIRQSQVRIQWEFCDIKESPHLTMVASILILDFQSPKLLEMISVALCSSSPNRLR